MTPHKIIIRRARGTHTDRRYIAAYGRRGPSRPALLITSDSRSTAVALAVATVSDTAVEPLSDRWLS
jgi:hypothetical protein